MIMLLALLPTVVLLVFIYKKDKLEKEPRKLLFKCFFWGMAIIIPILVMEEALGFIFEDIFEEGSVGYAIVDGYIVAAFSEELFKYIALKKRTWKSPEFNCYFDGIVYAVFVSVGFATVENIMYVFDGDISTALFRMFTAVPGHACDAVFMGVFYSKAKKAFIDGNKASYKTYKRLALFIPIFLHGTYDFLVSMEEEVVGEALLIWALLAWFALVIVEFIVALCLVNSTSKTDAYFVAPVTDERTLGDGV